MKKQNVPQHDEKLLNGMKEIQYAVDEEGNYTQVKSLGWKPKNDALKQAINLADELIEDARQQVVSGEKSPIYFYMKLKQMNYTILKQYTRYCKFKIKKHCRAKGFDKLNNKILQKYANSFNISIAELKEIPKEAVNALEYNFNFKIENKQIN